MILEDFQKRCLVELENELAIKNIACLAYYTGSGKTNIFLELAKRALRINPDLKIGISSYLTTEVKDQTNERIREYYKSIINDVYVFNPQSIYKQKARIKFDILIIDECHAGMSEQNIMINKIIKTWCEKDCKILLVSATPWDILSQKRFENVKATKRSIEDGLKDGRIADVQLYFEKNKLKFRDSEFSRSGNLKDQIVTARHAIIKSECIGEFKNILKRYNKELGNKVLVICPPGNGSEVAREMASIFDGLPFIFYHHSASHEYETQDNLTKFKQGDKRFLFVTHKCTVGFDMPELDTIIDLTMTRNIKTLVQRLGRVSRKNGSKDKRYFYVHDETLTDKKLEWLVGNIIDFSMGKYDGWITKEIKYRQIKSYKAFIYQENSPRISEIIKAIEKSGSVENNLILRYCDSKKPKIRNLKIAMEDASQYESRHDLFKKDPSLYKWFRTRGLLDELSKVQPLVNPRKWNEGTVIECLIKCQEQGMSRREIRSSYRGAYDWIESNGRRDLIEKCSRASRYKYPYWDSDKVIAAMKECKTWNELRYKYSGARYWINRNSSIKEYRKLFLDMKRAENPNKAILLLKSKLDKIQKKQIKQIKQIKENKIATPKFIKPPRPVYKRDYNKSRPIKI